MADLLSASNNVRDVLTFCGSGVSQLSWRTQTRMASNVRNAPWSRRHRAAWAEGGGQEAVNAIHSVSCFSLFLLMSCTRWSEIVSVGLVEPAFPAQFIQGPASVSTLDSLTLGLKGLDKGLSVYLNNISTGSTVITTLFHPQPSQRRPPHTNT